MNCIYLLDADTARRRILPRMYAACTPDVLPAHIAAQESYPSGSPVPLNASLYERKSLQRPVKLLSIGDDPSLLNTRGMVLASVGYDVTSLSSVEALETQPFSRFACVLICHSIPESKAVLLANLARREKPRARILRLCLFRSAEHRSFTSICDTMHDPRHFVADVKAVLNTTELLT